MNELKIFENEEFGQIRSIEIDGLPYFVGKDVAEILGYERADNAIRNHIDEEDKLMHQISASGQNRNMIIINESGLYSLILSSKLPTAKQFKRWVTSEVLPAIRKHGTYATDGTLEKMLTSPDFGIRLLSELKKERQAREEAEEKITEMTPKVIFADAVSVSKTSILVGELAKVLNQNGVKIGEKRLFQWLRRNGYLIKREGTDQNIPTQKAMELKLFEIKQTPIIHSTGDVTIAKTTKVTGKGQQYFIRKFLEEKEKTKYIEG